MRRRLRITALAALAALGGGALAASPASAAFHLMKIREIGQGGTSQTDYVELQMYSAGENFVSGKRIRTYDETGAVRTTFTFPRNVALGDNQRTIYVSRNEGTIRGNPDFATPNLILTQAGAVCYGAGFAPGAAVDCVSYGTFPGVPGGNPSPMGRPAPAPVVGQAIRRSIAPNCSTLLEAADDTDDGATDFTRTSAGPRRNAAAPTEQECPATTIDKKPKKKGTKRKVKVKFSSDDPTATFECSLDEKPFKACESPFKKKVKLGKHTFEVQATNSGGGAGDPEKVKFKVKPKK